MRLLLVRHAPSLGQKNAKNYAKYGDMHVPLDPDHADLSVKCGEFLHEYYQQTQTKSPPHVFTSQFLRAQQTCSGIRTGLKDIFTDAVSLRVDPLLNEQSFGVLPYVQGIQNPVKRGIANVFLSLSQALYKSDPFMNKALMGQSPMETYTNTRMFLGDVIDGHIAQGDDDFLIISHGAVMKSFVMNLLDLYDSQAWNTLDTPNNCDVYEVIKTSDSVQIHKIYDGVSGTDLRDNPIPVPVASGQCSAPTWDNLPPI